MSGGVMDLKKSCSTLNNSPSTGERHSVGGSSYGAVRTGAFMGLKILRSQPDSASGRPDCLANVASSEWHGLTGSDGLVRHCPERLTGRAFLERYGAHIDAATTVEDDATYEVRAATAHPIGESLRVRLFAALLAGPPGAEQRELLGELMRASHASYGACGLGSAGTDRLVQLVEASRRDSLARGEAPLLHGAKITGGGSGGTVCVLATDGPEAERLVEGILAQYAEERGGPRPAVFRSSSDGAAAFGCVRLQGTAS